LQEIARRGLSFGGHSSYTSVDGASAALAGPTTVALSGCRNVPTYRFFAGATQTSQLRRSRRASKGAAR